MKRYIAFLRGINISGKNKVPMEDLKELFRNSGFSEVKTYLNSGNIIFSSEENETTKITKLIETILKKQFDFEIPVFVIPNEELKNILNHAPVWWGDDNKEIYDNLIFLIPPTSFSQVLEEIGEPKKEFEKIEEYKNVIFWSFVRKDYQKTNWWSKTASAKISKNLTIRTANTVKKIVE